MAFGFLFTAAALPPADAQGCSEDLFCGFNECRSPASGVPAALWGDLAPVDEGQLPPDRDNTDFNEIGGLFNEFEPHWISLDVENGWIFAAINRGLQIWDARDPLAADPDRVAIVGRSGFPYWKPGFSEVKDPVHDVDAPDGVDTVVAVSLTDDMGLSIFDTSDKIHPRGVYADKGKLGPQVYAARINGTDYAFMATQADGLLAYNMTAAALLTTPCVDETPAQQLCGVYVGRLGTRTNFSYVDGAGNAAGTKHWVAAPSGGADRGVEIWNVSSPSAPTLALRGLLGQFLHGVALWRDGSAYYLAIRAAPSSSTELRIYDVSCLGTSNCTALGAPIFTRTLPGAADAFYTTDSKSGNRTFLYVGSSNRCSQGPQNEWLYDVTTPSQPVDVTPPPGLVNGQETGYWGWYYRRNPTGFNRVTPRMGKFNGPYFYRAGYSIFDIHQLTGGVPPGAAFSYSPATVYQGQPVNFTDQSTGQPNSWVWSFPDSNCTSPTCVTQQHPAGVIFSSTGAKTVTLTASNDVGSDTASQQIQVQSPMPAVGSVTASPNPALVCQPITFTANNVTGFPAPTLSWQLKDGAGNDVPPIPSAGNVNPFVWSTSPSTPAGTYTATVTATNGAGSANKTSPVVTLNALPPLPGDGAFTPTNDPFTAATVQFHVAAPGATEWNWDFGVGLTGWTNNPTAGPNPVHTYTDAEVQTACSGQLPCTFNVRVQVRNCIGGPVTSAVLPVEITNLEPLVANFAADCGPFGCFFEIGDRITFRDLSEGDPDAWAYDWNNTIQAESGCNFNPPDESGPAPVLQHIYLAAGAYFPCLRVTRGAETDVYLHPRVFVTQPAPPPPPPPPPPTARVTVACTPTTALVGQAISCVATASNCSPRPTLWDWSVGAGGSIADPNNVATISVTYSQAGNKTVQAAAENGGCIGTSGFQSVSINAPAGEDLHANFTFAPAAPEVGQVVTFNGAGSTGSPEFYTWDFGDGDSGEGVQVTHAFAQAGSYTVALEVSRNDVSCNFGLCDDITTRTVVVTSSAPPPEASFETSAECTSGGFGVQCNAETGEEVSFTSTSQNATAHAWSFGDGGTASGRRVTHTWADAGDYVVNLTVENAEGATDSASAIFVVEEAVVVDTDVLLPWIASTSGAFEQTSDLYVNNPNPSEIDVEITFRKRGTPEAQPPTVTRSIAPGATLYAPDALAELFGLGDAAGFLYITSSEKAGHQPPVVASYNRTFRGDGTTYGQNVPGIATANLDAVAASGSGVQYLLGLNVNSEKLSYFGITNAHPEPASYRLRFFDRNGELLASTGDTVISRWGQRQYQQADVLAFGISDEDDFRVEIEQVTGGTLFAYAGVVRLSTGDPSFVRVSVPDLERTYLFGVANTPGFAASLFSSDAVLSNPTAETMVVEITYLNVGPESEPEDTVTLPLSANQTLRLEEVLFNTWGVEGGVGVLTFAGPGAGGRFPMIHGETFQIGGGGTRYGLFMPARGDREVAEAGQRVIATGLRQLSGDSNTTLWLFNPGDQRGAYELVYRDLDGAETGRISGYAVPGGKIRQINPLAHPLPAGGLPGGFTVEIQVLTGQLLVGAQVVNEQSNDPAYVAGEVR